MKNVIFGILEGSADDLFFTEIIKPKLSEKYVHVLKYENHARTSKEDMEDFIRYLDHQQTDYIVFSDLDDAKSCKIKKNTLKKSKMPNVNIAKIAIVKTEIESWYLAGLTSDAAHLLRINPLPNTDDIDKEMFNDMVPDNIPDHAFRRLILRQFVFEVAKEQNKSFKHFCNQFLD